MTVLNIENLTYYYNHPEDYLFQDVTETFEAGIMYSILGQSGSGKTTLLSLLAGLDMPKSGQIKLNGDEIKANQFTNYRKNIVSTIFQAYNLLTYMSAFENVKTALRISKVSFDDEKQSIIDSLEKVGLTEDSVSKLSGGQQQRVAIARALVLNHDIIIADEPTGNLDENTTRQIVELFKKIAHEDHKLVIIVTHETEVAQNSDVVYQLKNKKFTKLDAF